MSAGSPAHSVKGVAFLPETAVAIVRAGEGSERSVTGSAAAFGGRAVALTASHCVPDDMTGLSLHFPWRQEFRIVTDVDRHPTADLAILHTRLDQHDERRTDADAFSSIEDDLERGGEFRALGFPVEGPADAPGEPVPRVFVGHYQRFFTFEGLSGYRFFAGEMSIPAPGGLSGGPVYSSNSDGALAAIVSTNMESYSIIDSYEEQVSPGHVERGEIRRQISYGVCVLLSEVATWLQDHGQPQGPTAS